MKKLILLPLIVSSAVAFANLIEFQDQDRVKASDVNTNFSYIKSLLSSKNVQVSFDSFNSGELILKETFEAEFNKLRVLGINIDPLPSNTVKSIDLNRAFNQSQVGSLIYDDAPSALASSFSTSEDLSYSGTFGYTNLVGNTTIELFSSPANGNVTYNGFNYSYTPKPNYSGPDSFSFKVFDGAQRSSPATISINILPVNDAPVVTSKNVVTNEDTSLAIELTGSDVENSPLTYTVLTEPTKGSLSVVGANRIYTPNPNFSGTDSFTFKANDGELDSVAATISITINPVNDAPSISGGSLTTVINSSAVTGSISVSDIDSASFSYIVTTQPTKGSFAFTSGGNYSYTPSLNKYGSDFVVVKVNDGTADSNLLTIPVTITGSGIIFNAATNSKMYFDGSYASSCNAYKTGTTFPKTYSGSTGSGVYRIQSGAEVIDAYCEMDAQGGGWTLVAFNNGTSGLANMPANFFASIRNPGGMLNINASNTASSLNLERMSSWLSSKDIMFVAPAYGASFNPLVELNAGGWNYNSSKCGGTFRHSSRTSGCGGQNANDDYTTADSLNFAFNNGQEGIVPHYLNSGHELCYSGRGWCTFKVYFR